MNQFLQFYTSIIPPLYNLQLCHIVTTYNCRQVDIFILRSMGFSSLTTNNSQTNTDQIRPYGKPDKTCHPNQLFMTSIQANLFGSGVSGNRCARGSQANGTLSKSPPGHQANNPHWHCNLQEVPVQRCLQLIALIELNFG